jgi:hypothetical protein
LAAEIKLCAAADVRALPAALFRQICDGHHRQRLNNCYAWKVSQNLGASMMTKGIIAAVAFMFALTFGMLTAKVAQSDNDRASNPTIRTMVLQY